MTAAIAVGILAATGTYLIFQRGLIRITIGFVMLGHAANIIVVAAGGMSLRSAPLLGHGPAEEMADPLPQAFVLTAIVITFGITVYLLALARGGGEEDPGDDALDPDTPDEPDGEDDVDPDRRADLGHGSDTPEWDEDVSHITDERAEKR
ncbi:NADH-quinone oxidoreductase subunit K [Natronosporangium hydrolyticum]|uniref:NADH-quinone oxidoreductase subunit K n=1 Tax=Natronosporangium hydrolyticum TaxID=2811111 RepID=A0A895YHB8_9ACTN|nr:NADH-quinone oxidoreductase subunit K [Natronosporangium hydrolyticum]QSB13108.1 NADH-quinone oxidoreductase subunit K [Natronosporangium hydrolyticum]